MRVPLRTASASTACLVAEQRTKITTISVRMSLTSTATMTTKDSNINISNNRRRGNSGWARLHRPLT